VLEKNGGRSGAALVVVIEVEGQSARSSSATIQSASGSPRTSLLIRILSLSPTLSRRRMATPARRGGIAIFVTRWRPLWRRSNSSYAT
jgi:hypothetical protein